MRVLVTGHRGYLGSVLTGVLRHARHEVVGLDCDWYTGCDFGRVREEVPCFDTDLRDVESVDLLSFDAVIHLASLPDDGAGTLDPELTEQINFEATMRLAACCKQARISRFLFASSCAVYGRGGNDLLDEQSLVEPMTQYASAKLRCEREIARLADSGFTPVFLRNATLYGVSPRIRLDIVVNDFVGAAVTTGRIAVKTAGQAWRPLLHVEDAARACAALLRAPDEGVHNQVFNVVQNDENHRVIEIADRVAELVPHCTRTTTSNVFDERSYRVDGSKLARTFPKFRFRWTLQRGIRQLYHAMLGAGLTPGDWRSDRYRRLLRLQSLLERGPTDLELHKPSIHECSRPADPMREPESPRSAALALSSEPA